MSPKISIERKRGPGVAGSNHWPMLGLRLSAVKLPRLVPLIRKLFMSMALLLAPAVRLSAVSRI